MIASQLLHRERPNAQARAVPARPAAFPATPVASVGGAHRLANLVDGAPVIQGFWPFTGYGYFFNRAPAVAAAVAAVPGAAALAPGLPGPAPAVPVVVPALAATLPQTARTQLIQDETDVMTAVATLPATFRAAWAPGLPAVVDDPINALFAQVRNMVAFASAGAADAFKLLLDAAHLAATQYIAFVAAVRPKAETAAAYHATYTADLTGVQKTGFVTAARNVRDADATASQVNTVLDGFLNVARTATGPPLPLGANALAPPSETEKLQTEQATALGSATTRVERYFQLQRIRIGKNRSYYESPFDMKAGSFGGEWALEAPDATLTWMKQNWVFHSHGQGVGDPSSGTYDGFTFKPNASHVKQEALRMSVGVSIPVDAPAEFARIEHDSGQQERFVKWSTSPVGRDKLRRSKRGEV